MNGAGGTEQVYETEREFPRTPVPCDESRTLRAARRRGVDRPTPVLPFFSDGWVHGEAPVMAVTDANARHHRSRAPAWNSSVCSWDMLSEDGHSPSANPDLKPSSLRPCRPSDFPTRACRRRLRRGRCCPRGAQRGLVIDPSVDRHLRPGCQCGTTIRTVDRSRPINGGSAGRANPTANWPVRDTVLPVRSGWTPASAIRRRQRSGSSHQKTVRTPSRS